MSRPDPLNQVQWRAVPGYEETHEVSTDGQVRSRPRQGTPGGLLTPTLSKRGYLAVGLSNGNAHATVVVHRLVALAFLGPRPSGTEIRHLNGDHTDNRLQNLLYGSKSENMLDSVLHGSHANAKKTHCLAGHSFAEHGSVRISAQGRPVRKCMLCQREWNRQYLRRRRAARKAASLVGAS